MADRSFGEELAGELAGRAVIWGPSLAGAILLGPVGLLLGLAASAALVASSSDSAPPGGGQDPRGRK